MKKVIALLAVFILCFNLSYTQPVRADTFSIPFSAVPDLINAFYTIAAGGKIEFSALIGDMTGIDDFWQNLHDYYDTHYTQPLLQSTQGLVDIGLSGLALDGVSSIDSTNNISIPVTPQDIANFMGYDVNWTDRYNDVEEIVVNPDHTYDAYLNKINLRSSSDVSNFWFYNIPSSYNANATVVYSISNLPVTSFSWIALNTNNNIFPDAGSFQTPNMTCSDILTININSSGSTYSYSISGYGFADVVHNNVQAMLFNYVKFTSGNSSYDNYRFYWGGGDAGAAAFNYSYSGTLADCLTDIGLHFKNVNIVVDGNIWSYVGDVQNPGISLNDYTDVGNTGNITYDVFPLVSSGDIGLDLAKWGEYIYNQCISGDGILTMDTVIDDGWDLVDTDDGTRAITTEDEEDVAKVIHGFVGTTATTPTPTPDIGDPPVLKIIPPILELPDEIWPDGGRDTTVLAQIIHSTDVIMPNDIMTILWSILGILVIGGLLTILHK